MRWELNPRHAAWEATVLPLNDARDGREMTGGKGPSGMLETSLLPCQTQFVFLQVGLTRQLAAIGANGSRAILHSDLRQALR